MIDEKGIVEFTINNKIYRCWTVEFIKSYIVKFLKERFPDSLLTFETNRIDIVIFDNKNDDIIPVEIQRTYPRGFCSKGIEHIGFTHTSFEDRIRRQLEDNIENYDKCWLFFDSEYLRYLQGNDVIKTVSINMNWLVKYMKEDMLNVFVIRYDGDVEELSIKDFDFLKEVSQTCPLGHDNDNRILNRNKLKIFRDILRYYNFAQDEIDKMRDNFNNNKVDKENLITFSIRQSDKRVKLYGYILYSIGRLPSINNFLGLNIDNDQYKANKWAASYLGIFEIEGDSYKSSVRFFDEPDVCKHFPGYLRNKDVWNKLRGHNLTSRQLENIVTKKTNINKGIDYFWYEKDISNSKVICVENEDNFKKADVRQ